jgi:hypothetical protein
MRRPRDCDNMAALITRLTTATTMANPRPLFLSPISSCTRRSLQFQGFSDTGAICGHDNGLGMHR